MSETINTLLQPPHNMEAEHAVIGGVLFNGVSAARIILKSSAFYRREHRLIWDAVTDLQKAGEPIDVMTIADRLQGSGRLLEAGGIDYLSHIASSIYSTANIEHYAQIIQEHAQRRALISAAHGIADRGFNPQGRSIADLVSEAARQITAIDTNSGDDAPDMDAAIKEVIADLEKRAANKGKITGLETGFRDIDKKLQGLQKGEVWVIGGRPAMGKTAFALNICAHAALAGEPVLVFSLEMPRAALMRRVFAALGGVANEKLKSGDLSPEEWDRINAAANKLKGKPLYIDDTPERTSAQIRAAVRRFAAKHGRPPALVVIDYLQLMTDEGGDSRQGQISTMSRNVKLMAREHDTPVILLSQLNRSLEQRADKRPLMSDLRESGSIEQDADMVAMLYREKAYNPGAQEDTLEVIFRKMREGEIGTVYLRSALWVSRFENHATVNQVKTYQDSLRGLD